MRRLRPALAAALLVAVLVPGGPLLAQQPSTATQDSTPVFDLDEIVVTADRAESRIGTSAAAVSRISSLEVSRLPASNLADVLGLVPGFALVDFDGFGQAPQMMVRGFYGGGEAEYVQVLLDGKPVNDLQTGLMFWDLVPTMALESVEVVRGPASALYGDGAVAGVINLVSSRDAPPGGYWDFGAGEYRTFHAAVRNGGELALRPVSGFASGRRTEGYRDNSTRTVVTAGGQMDLVSGEDRTLSLSTDWMWRDLQRPGPRPEDRLATSRQPIELFYSYDGTEGWVSHTDVDGSFGLSPGLALSGRVSAELRGSNTVETIQPSLDTGDTQERQIDTRRFSGTLKLTRDDLGLPWRDRLIVGVDASLGSLDSEYREVVNGDRIRYLSFDPDRPIVATGEGTRTEAAAFGQYEMRPIDPLRLSLGVRFDRLADSFEPGEPGPGARTSVDNSAVSPKAGLNLRWLETGRQTGNVYVTAARTFRAPTHDQLFDQRGFPALPNTTVTISNPLLEPQRGTSLEVGAYHGVELTTGWTAGLSLAVYRMDMEDEIDFDPGTFTYNNIAESRHQGLELGAKVHAPLQRTLFVNYTLQDVTAGSGAFDGNALKAIPRHTVTAGLAGRVIEAVGAGIYLTRNGSVWLDDANTVRLPGFTRVDTRLSLFVLEAEITLQMRNALNSEYSTTGFLDLGASGTALLFPAALRVTEIGLRLGL